MHEFTLAWATQYLEAMQSGDKKKEAGVKPQTSENCGVISHTRLFKLQLHELQNKRLL